MLDHISNQYAKALFELSGDKYLLYLEQLELINKIIQENIDFEMFLKHPKITNEEKKNVFEKSLLDFEQLIRDFIFVLIDNKRIDLLELIITSYKDLYNEDHNIMEFELIGSSPISEKEIQEIKNILHTKYNKNIVINFNILPDYIGGLIIKHKDQVIDDSVLTRISNIKDFLKNRKLR